MTSEIVNHLINNSLIITKSDCVYTSCYCEENIWKLCEYIGNKYKNCLNDCYVVFISNDKKMIPLWQQRAGDEERDYLCVWDYHVIMIYAPNDSSRALVYDFDSQLSFPTDFSTYSRQTLRDENLIKAEFRRLFRVIEAQIYLNEFASNRAHMMRSDGTWIKAPPLYPCITTNKCDNNLNLFISMDCNQFGVGLVLDINQLNRKFELID